MAYPSSVISFSVKVDNVDDVQAAHVNDLQTEVEALEGGLLNGLAHDTIPATTGTYDLGSTSKKWEDLHMNGNALVGGTLGVTGITTLAGVKGGWSAIANTQVGAQNNWNPTGLSGHTLVVWAGVSALAVTGLEYEGTAGQILVFKNRAGAGIVATFAHNSGSSDANNKLINLVASAPTPVGHDGWIAYQHNGSVWHLIGYNQGEPITPTFAAGDYTAGGSQTWTVASGDVATLTYTLRGKMLRVDFQVNTTTVGGTPHAQLLRVVPGGFTATKASQSVIFIADNNTPAFGTASISAAGTNIAFGADAAGTVWTASTDLTAVRGALEFEID